MSFRGSPAILQSIRNFSGRVANTGFVRLATGLYLFFDAAKAEIDWVALLAE